MDTIVCISLPPVPQRLPLPYALTMFWEYYFAPFAFPKMFNVQVSSSGLLLYALSAFIALANTAPTDPLIVTAVPDHSRPYVLPHLTEPGVQLGPDIIRFPVTNQSSGGAFSLLRLSGTVNNAVPVHYHARFYESWFSIKGRVTLWANQETRVLSPHDFGAMPTFQNHSFRLEEPDSEFLAQIAPGGFDPFYLTVSSQWNNSAQSPFAPGRPLPIANRAPFSQGSIYDYWPVEYTLNDDVVNGTSSLSTPWHTGNSTLPDSDQHPYYIAANWGPKYLHRRLGQVVAPVLTTVQAKGNYTMTISTVAIRHKLANEAIQTHSFDKAQVFVVLEGQLTINMLGQTVNMGTGDVAFVPPGTKFQYWSTVAFTKVYLGSNGPALSDKLIDESEDWDYAVFPSYLGPDDS